MSWTDERIAKLTKMWEGGSTASQIAEDLGGVSRNAVIGKAHRLGLKARPSPVKPNEKTEVPVAKPVPAVARPTRAPNAPPPPPAPRPSVSNVTFSSDPAAPTVAGPTPTYATPSVPVPPPSGQRVVSVGPGGFLRQGPGDQQAPIPPAPPRRLVPAKPSAEMATKTSLLELNERICRWPMGHPGEADFHFCGVKVNPGFPYCVEHCGRAYQAQLPRGHRRPPPPLPFGGPRVR